MELKELKEFYIKLKPDIEKRLEEFRDVWKTGCDTELFSELCFCLLTPQSKAKRCWDAVIDLRKKGLLFDGSASQIGECLAGVRFKNNKANYVCKAKEQFPEIKNRIKNQRDILKLRKWLAENVCGMGYKEASHFLRNIGLGHNIAILDRHILKNLKLFNVIEGIPNSLSKRRYFDIEERIKKFSEKAKIPLSHLDLTMWAKETGEIFK